jgi:hypothetical protein
MMKMKKALDDLGPCAEVVKKTMMECFFVMERGIRAATQEAGITDQVAEDVGGQAGKCYEKGLKNLAKCMDEQEEQETFDLRDP